MSTSHSHTLAWCEQLFTELGEQELDWVAKTPTNSALVVPEALLVAAAGPNLGLASASLDFFLWLQDVPVAERAPSLRAPLYARLVKVLVRQAARPPQYSLSEEWAGKGCQVDSEDHAQFRRSLKYVMEWVWLP